MLHLLVRRLGGVWALRGRALAGRPWLRPHWARLYSLYLESLGSMIPLHTRFAGPPVFPHGVAGIFVSGDARIGRDCVIFQQVTIGSNTLPGSAGLGAPTIGDGCYLGAGAKIIGRVTVGDNVRIAANALVTRDVPANAVVVPSPPLVRERDALDNRYYSWRDGDWHFYRGGRWHRDGLPPAELTALRGADPAS